MEEEDKAAKDKAWERSQAMALQGQGFRFRGPARLYRMFPPSAPGLSIIAI